MCSYSLFVCLTGFEGVFALIVNFCEPVDYSKYLLLNSC
jgi:hypothetical protein